ncbi:MAG TPA: UPF0175 family protein [archaeon]|nr:UPF0175 family protein [archaeon]
MAESVSVRLDKDSMKQLNQLNKYDKGQKSSLLREVVELGIKDKRLEIALEKFRKNEATAFKAAEIAGVSLSEFLDALKQNNLTFHYSIEDLREEFEDL